MPPGRDISFLWKDFSVSPSEERHEGPCPHFHADRCRTPAVVGKAVVCAAVLLGMTNADLARTIGVSEATVSRIRVGSYRLESGTKPYELSLLLIRLFRGLAAVMGGEEVSIGSWMETANLALRGVPRALVQTVTGLVATVDYVDAARTRV